MWGEVSVVQCMLACPTRTQCATQPDSQHNHQVASYLSQHTALPQGTISTAPA